jgi:hypothetical protein
VRAAALVVLVLGCRAPTPEVDEPPWRHIAELAAPTVAPGKTDKLVEALAIRHRQLHARHPRPDRVDETIALSLFVDWSREGGAVPPSDPLSTAEPEPYDLGFLALNKATPETLAAVHCLGIRMLGEGLGILDAEIGLMFVRKARERSREVGIATIDWRPPQGALLRAVASEAMWLRNPRLITGPDADDLDALVAEAVARDEVARSQAFWLAALADAQVGEPDAVTLQRVRDTPGDDDTKRIVPLAEGLAKQLDELR